MKNSFSINDPIHSRIALSDVELLVIDHPIFQRLRRVKALGLLEKVFPSARHSRFEHSIGVSHVAGEILKALILNHSEIAALSDWNTEDEHEPWSKISNFLDNTRVQQIKLAALLHDVGHGPFSHASEGIMPLREDLIKSNSLPEYINKALRDRTKDVGSDGADHEDFSLILAWKILTDVKANHSDVNTDYIQDVLAFKFTTILPSNPINTKIFALFRVFVDGEFDSDRMDYLLRDSYFCGVPYGRFDLTRLLEGLYVLKNKKSNDLVLGLKKSSLSAFEDFLFARFQMHSQVYSHRVDSLFNSALTVLAKANGSVLPSQIEKYTEIDDESFLYSSHMNSSVELNKLLLNRKKWLLVYETSDSTDSTPDEVSKKINNDIGKGLSSVGKSKRPFRKPDVLKLPIVIRDRKGMFHTERLDRIALILNSYESVFFAKRVFVHPDHLIKATSIIEEVEKKKTKINPIQVQHELKRDIHTAEQALQKNSKRSKSDK